MAAQSQRKYSSAMRSLLCLALVLAACKQDAPPRPSLSQVARTCHKDFGCPRTILYVQDLHASQRYYHDKLGFKIDWTDGDPADFGAVTRGDTQLFMCERCQGHPGTWVWIFTPDVDRLYDELVRRGATIKSPPDDKPWGVREMQVADLDGNVLRLASPKKR